MPFNYRRQYAPQQTQDYVAAQQAREAARIQAENDSAMALAQQRAALQAEKIKADRAAAAAKQAAAFNALTTHTNSAWNLQQAKQNKPRNIDVITKVGDRTVKQTLTPDEYQTLKNEEKIKALTDERILESGKWFGRGADRVAAIDKEIAAVKSAKPEAPNLLGGNGIVPTAAAPDPIQSASPTMFSGTTSMTGPGIAPVKGSAFIGDPHEENAMLANRFVDTSGRVDAPAVPAAWGRPAAEATQSAPPPDLLSSQGFSPSVGDLRVAEAQQPQPKTAAPTAGKIVIQGGNKFRINPDGSAEHIGPAE